MDSKDNKSMDPKTSRREVVAHNDSHTKPSDEASGERPGEAIMKSGDPSTAALRAWAEEKQKQVPGSNGSFATGQMSMGVGAVSGGPVFLPRKEVIVDPPYHSMDHGPAEVVKHEHEGEGSGKKTRHSLSDLFKRKGKEEGKGEEAHRKSGLETQAKEDVVR